MAQVVKHLPSKSEALSSNPSTTKGKNKPPTQQDFILLRIKLSKTIKSKLYNMGQKTSSISTVYHS
jgi:hypothetical protein